MTESSRWTGRDLTDGMAIEGCAQIGIYGLFDAFVEAQKSGFRKKKQKSRQKLKKNLTNAPP